MRSRLLTAQQLVAMSFRRRGSDEAVVDAQRRVAVRDLDDRSARLANVLLAGGATSDRPVAALVANRVEYVEVDVAATRAGIPRVGLSDRLSPEEWDYILGDSNAAVLVVSTAFADRLSALPDTIETVLVVDDAPAGGATWGRARALGFEAAIADASPALSERLIDPHATNYILYTSGTTGRPKGAAHSHAGRAAATLNMLAFELRARRHSAMAHVGPLTHGSGSKVLTFLAAGGRSVILDRFEPELLARAVRDERVTHTFVVPTMLQRLMQESADVRSAIAGLEQISFGGSPIAPSVFRAAIEAFGPTLVQVYGSSEAPHPITILGPEGYLRDDADHVLTSAGVPSPGVELRIVDADGAPAGNGTVGELLVRAPHVMSGYWRNPGATQEAIDDDGWYITGDLVSTDEEGLITFQDRKRDLIISGGLNVYPSEVERVLVDHPLVRQAVVIGIPDDEWGESVLAYVVPHEDGSVTEALLTEWIKERLASYKKPRTYEFCAELPTGASHKVVRSELREAYWKSRGRAVN
jgi:acyl-CoA synthetase (AMP-forming)/AMP-acid ligase II